MTPVPTILPMRPWVILAVLFPTATPQLKTPMVTMALHRQVGIKALQDHGLLNLVQVNNPMDTDHLSQACTTSKVPR
jgi:hypothetical protein